MSVNIPILKSYGVVIKPDGEDDCDIYDLNAGKPIFATLFVFAYLLPLAVIAAFSLLILRHITAQRAACSTLVSVRSVQKGSKGQGGGRKQQASLLLVLVVVLFALLWLPVHLYLLMSFFVDLPNNDFSSAVAV